MGKKPWKLNRYNKFPTSCYFRNSKKVECSVILLGNILYEHLKFKFWQNWIFIRKTTFKKFSYFVVGNSKTNNRRYYFHLIFMLSHNFLVSTKGITFKIIRFFFNYYRHFISVFFRVSEILSKPIFTFHQVVF